MKAQGFQDRVASAASSLGAGQRSVQPLDAAVCRWTSPVKVTERVAHIVAAQSDR